ncbi:unnamed protein product [Zymoseptoria tritici ST99CH_1A5]|uniref:Uncharacterized protein n=1 Tax=Zymoseptoria tritici ST99CH_1A5 TaxID=1276529 RepID=A0A1Y6M5I3_ZYMTR|nr:unnamed protein product [Zymoseptoria tritici ST99CH_1A5]
MARTRRRRTSSERPSSVEQVDRHAEIRLLLDREAAENDTDNDATVARVQRQALSAPHSPLVILRAWWWEKATREETGTKYWATSDVIDKLAVKHVTRLEELLGGDAKAGWAKAAKTFAECMGWSKFPKLHIYAMFGDMLRSRQFLDCTRELIGLLKSRKKAVCRLRAVREERRAGQRKGRNVNSKADWVAGDAKAALDAFKAETSKAADATDEEENNDDSRVDTDGEENNDDSRVDTDGEENNDDSRVDTDEEESNEDSRVDTDEEESNEDSGVDETAEKEDGENTEDNGFETRGDEDDGHGSEASVECEQGRGGGEALLDQSSFNGLDDGAEGARSESESPHWSEIPQDVPHESTLTSRAKCTTTSAAFTAVSSPKPASPFIKIDASSPKPDNICAINLNAITSTANDSSSRTADMRKRELGSMSDDQPNAKRRLGQQLQIASVATPPPQRRDLDSWLTAVSAGRVGEEVGGDEERAEDDFKVLHRDLQDTTARPHASRTCIIYYNGDERAAAAYVDHRTNTPAWQTYVPVGSTVKVNAFADVISREFDGQSTILDFTPACTSTTDWSLVAVLTCLCMHRPIPDGAAAYPPIWQYALRTLVADPEAVDLDTHSAIATVTDVLPSGDAVSESVSPQPYSRFESAHVLRTQAIRKALKEKIALAKALLVDAALIASLASVALDRLGPGDDSDNVGSIQQQIDCHKASLKAQRDLVKQSARNQLARMEVSRLEALVNVLEKSLEAQPVSIPGINSLRVVQRHMQHLAGFIAAREIEYTGELSLND